MNREDEGAERAATAETAESTPPANAIAGWAGAVLFFGSIALYYVGAFVLAVWSWLALFGKLQTQAAEFGFFVWLVAVVAVFHFAGSFLKHGLVEVVGMVQDRVRSPGRSGRGGSGKRRSLRAGYPSPELHGPLLAAEPAELRKVALVACEFALAETGLDDPPVSEAMAALREGRPCPPSRQAKLQALADALDARYFALEEAAEKGSAAEQEWLPFFRKARAANALWFATSDDPLEAASDAVYEASHTVDDPAELFDRVEQVLEST